MLGIIARLPWWANFRVVSLDHSSHPGAWWIRTTPGKGPEPRGRAKYALITEPSCPGTVTVSAIIPSYVSVRYLCMFDTRLLWTKKGRVCLAFPQELENFRLRLYLPNVH